MSSEHSHVWDVVPPPPLQEVQRLASALGISPTVASILITRGYDTPQRAREFLSATMEQQHDPFLFPDMDKAVRRLKQAIDGGEKILVYGDYDVDGVTSTAMLVRWLSALKANVTWHIPHRVLDDYGVNEQAVRAAAREGVSLILTADCGITAVKEVKGANELGVDVIVTDHHEPSDELPPAVAVINPKRQDTPYPFADLAGVGVAFKLATAYMRTFSPQHEQSLQRAFLDLAALGTVADVMPLVGENRLIVREGLKLIAHTKKLGLRALLSTNSLYGKPITAYHIGFVLGPRLNAAGRMDTARTAVQLLLTSDEQESVRLAQQLNQTNRERQEEEKRIFEEAVKMVEADGALPPALVLGSPRWHRGIVGLVASRMVERFYRPTLLVAFDGDVGKGSGRSIEAFHLLDALRRCSHHLEKCGGHRLAAGLAVKVDKFPVFREAFCQVAGELLSADDLRRRVTIDAELSGSDLTSRLVEELQQLEPFGSGNPPPTLCLRRAEVVDKLIMGSEKQHLKLKVRSDGKLFDCVWWRRADRADGLAKGQAIDLCFTAEFNEWGGVRSVQLKVKDVRAVPR
jgi:single-stranded-DNA-specific exonuclease